MGESMCCRSVDKSAQNEIDNRGGNVIDTGERSFCTAVESSESRRGRVE